MPHGPIAGGLKSTPTVVLIAAEGRAGDIRILMLFRISKFEPEGPYALRAPCPCS